MARFNAYWVVNVATIAGELALLEREKAKLDSASQRHSSLLTVVKGLRQEKQETVEKLSQLKVRATLKQETVEKLSQLKVRTTLKQETVDKLSQLKVRPTLKQETVDKLS